MLIKKIILNTIYGVNDTDITFIQLNHKIKSFNMDNIGDDWKIAWRNSGEGESIHSNNKDVLWREKQK